MLDSHEFRRGTPGDGGPVLGAALSAAALRSVDGLVMRLGRRGRVVAGVGPFAVVDESFAGLFESSLRVTFVVGVFLFVH